MTNQFSPDPETAAAIAARNADIVTAHAGGEPIKSIADRLGLKVNRIQQIVRVARFKAIHQGTVNV